LKRVTPEKKETIPKKKEKNVKTFLTHFLLLSGGKIVTNRGRDQRGKKRPRKEYMKGGGGARSEKKIRS